MTNADEALFDDPSARFTNSTRALGVPSRI